MPKKVETESDIAAEQQEVDEAEIEYITNHKKTAKKKKTESKDAQLKKLEAEISELKEECEAAKQEYVRQVADKENLRKRLEKEKTDYYQFALSDIISEVLVVLDNFERALESEGQKDSKNFHEGVEMIYKQLFSLLKKHGVQPIEIKDKAFNPHLHQAFMTEESEDVQEPEIGQEFQRGYTLHDRLLRPSLVKVIVPKKES
ncbi:MAG: nucleotide exchange factor GrpE [Candidatus Aminicenantes bacterium]|nr:nucleotide exchange factor GrpE [Candidatus Aminicenantes bacterium]